MLRRVRFVRRVPQLDVSVKELSAGRDADSVFNSNVAAAQGAAVYRRDRVAAEEAVRVVPRADNAQEHLVLGARI